MTNIPLYLYIHIPFCSYGCYFCSFVKAVNKSEFIEKYIEVLSKEIEDELKYITKEKKYTIKGIYFGGGTPNSLNISQYKTIFKVINKYVDSKSLEEISVEIAPNSVEKEYFTELKNLGVSRITIGLQTFNDNIRNKSGRIHSLKDFLYSFNNAREAGFTNVGVDLIIGFPDQTENIVANDIVQLIKLKPEHISVYILAIEEGTVFYKLNDKLIFLEDDSVVDSYNNVAKELEKNNYIQYEISNWAKKGYECKYNLYTWKFGEYLGFGVSASSHFQGKRWTNTNSLSEYLSGENKHEFAERDNRDIEFEKVLLGLRLNKGFELKNIQDNTLRQILKNYSGINVKKDTVFLKSQNRLIYNKILTDLYNLYKK